MKTELLEVDKSSGASHKVYFSVDDFRMKHPNDVKANFIVSKSRLTPLRTVTLPRLELMGYVALARLCVYLSKTFPLIKEGSISFWSDSQIYLHRVKRVSILWKHYVQNKENEIKEETFPMNWYFCDGKTNPASKFTRGITIHNLMNDETWWTNPSWLLELDIPAKGKTLTADKESVERQNTMMTLQMTMNSKSFTAIYESDILNLTEINWYLNDDHRAEFTFFISYLFVI
ncbi:hypothetical protein AVEN_183209-1 [Araneus ventricosus]|uniref:Uncharacterized protein n=1 Tax=Araneus ventricosus TaxID=182803 RepID=A0A4Y2ENY4_ARAVE|nr:hypothetical protein AVEN_183209-1 [Araneus ventricosus]